jgi:formylglycine-generating enzyme required for sulfatase activity
MLTLLFLTLLACQSTPPQQAELTSVVIAPSRLALQPGQTRALTLRPVPPEATVGEVRWESGDEEVAAVTGDGVVRAVSVGETTITATVAEGLTATARVTVESRGARRLVIEPSSVVLLPGERRRLDATIVPEGATAELRWQSGDEDVFVVDSRGRVTARNPGTAVISVIAGSLEQSALVVVKERLTAAESEVTFSLVPEATFFGGIEETEEHSAGPLWLADRPVTAELWQTVHAWATTDVGNETRADGGPLYEIPSAGRKGNDGAPEKSLSHPVTRVSWRSALVWLNALTEYFNALTETNLEPVYYTDSSATEPLRRASRAELVRRDVLYSQDNPYVKEEADGFRLPRSLEWELAARYILDGDGDESISEEGEEYPGDYATGADAPYNAVAEEDFDGDGILESTGEVAVYDRNSGGSTAEVASKEPNALGIYDMSGNVFEWVFEWHPTQLGQARTVRGGSWASPAAYMRLGLIDYAPPYFEDGITGFRIARNAARIAVRDVVIVEGPREIRLGGSLALEARVIPENAYNRDLLWESSSPGVATVSPTGVVTGQEVGTSTITVRTADGGYEAAVTVEVTVPVQGLTLSRQSGTMAVGEEIPLTATITPPDASERGVTWRSDEPEVARVSAEGVVRGVAPGTTTVTVRTRDGRFSERFTAVVRERRSLGEVELVMSEVPALRFPLGIDDNQVGSVSSPFWIGSTEVTYTLWEQVRSWATAEERGEEVYTFDTAGRAGGAWPEPTRTGPEHPVTEISWASAVVWANALTEFYNSENGSQLRPVYYGDRARREPLRDARILVGRADSPPLYLDGEAGGFRLLSEEEWELAARYRGADSGEGAIEFPKGSDHWWTPGNYASGAAGSVDDRAATLAVAVVEEPPGSTSPVAGKRPNTLGLYDMSGNIAEWVLRRQEEGTLTPVRRGGSWFSTLSELRVSALDPLTAAPGIMGFSGGLRIGRGGIDGAIEPPEVTRRVVPPRAALTLEEETALPAPPEADREALAPPSGPVAEEAIAEITPPPEAGPGSVEATIADIPLVYVPAATFPSGLEDLDMLSVERPFLMGTTEVTLELWRQVRRWAQEEAGYRIVDEGSIHPDVPDGGNRGAYPVGRIGWWAAVTWANALTEYVNAKKGGELELAYYLDQEQSRPVRDSEAAGRTDNPEAPYLKEGARGFRLPTSAEWELAARWGGEEPQGDQFTLPGESRFYWNPGKSVSGAVEPVENREGAAIFAVFSTDRPEPVASRQPNALGIFDMSGNVAEVCYDWRRFMVGRRRVSRGGSYRSDLQGVYVGRVGSVSATGGYLPMHGLRVVRTAP